MSDRLGKVLAGAACVAGSVAGVVGVADTAEAAVFSSGVVNIPVPANIDGVYLNVITGATGTAGAAVTGWDINPYATSGAAGGPAFFSPSTPAGTHGVVSTGTGTSASPVNLAVGAVVGPASTFTAGAVLNPAGALTPGVPAIVGFRFIAEPAGTQHYGYLRIIPPSSSTIGSAGTIIEYAYEGTPNTAIVVPEPASLSLLALGAVGLLRRRSVA